ncbi:putative cytochrome P450 E-class, group IV [Cladorrhinum sp. PSN259]|nr:putative cytochrome P450 E-class, group IV [Cladorrhinum sp. PSN259]
MALTDAITRVLHTDLHLFLPTVGVLIAVLLAQTFLRGNPLRNIPVVGAELGSDEKRRQVFLERASQVYLDGYNKFQKGIFRVVTSNKRPHIVVPAKYLNELRNLPDDTVSFDGAVVDSMHTKYTKLETGHTLVPHVIKSNLTPALVRLNPSIAEEVQESFQRELPPCDDWTPVNINQKLLRIVAVVSGRVFLGQEVARTEEYIDAAINYTVEVMNARRVVDRMRPWLRPFLAWRLPEVKKLDERLANADRLLQPLVAQRRNLKETDQKPEDMLQWILNGQGGKYRSYTTAELARLQLGLSFAAIHTTTLTSTNVFYNLAAYPQYIPILRDEIKSALAEHNGVFSSLAMQNMKRLDSFMKESLRVDPLGSASFTRKVTKTFTLSSGQVIPEGVQIEVPAEAISRDPEIFPNPEEFQPWRFYELRANTRGEQAAQHQFVSIGQNILTFGYGRHACPGRFFAANEVKMMVANALLTYDIRLPDGVEGRYPNFKFGGQCVPDPTKELLFKRISRRRLSRNPLFLVCSMISFPHGEAADNLALCIPKCEDIHGDFSGAGASGTMIGLKLEMSAIPISPLSTAATVVVKLPNQIIQKYTPKRSRSHNCD